MRRTRSSRLLKGLISGYTFSLCVILLLAAGLTPNSIVPPTTAWAATPQEAGIPLTCTELGLPSIGAAGSPDLFWKDRKVLRVRFLDGSEFLMAKVRYYAQFWSDYANIRFEFKETGLSDIRVSFNPDGSSWSYIGNSAKGVDESEPTMNFGWFNESTTAVEFRRTILHEFGHALGLIHEHQSPGATINWNKPVVYKYYWEHFRWNQSLVDSAIFAKYSKARTQYTAYDPTSIMHYPIPAEFTTDGTSVGWNTKLSKMDIDFIKNKYP